MPIPLPNLDDRSFTDLVEEMRALIPRYAPSWTDHNLSDPGITLIDLFAWLTEALIYRLNRITAASEARFLELLGAEFKAAQPATVGLVLTATGLTEPLLVPLGTPLLARTGDGTTSLSFETVQAVQLTPENPGGTVEARQALLLVDEYLGSSNGKPHQLFPVGRPFLIHDPIQQLPRLTVEGVAWTCRASLLESRSTDAHYTIDSRLSAIRFGDGTLGRIPPHGASILVSYYTTQGRGGNIPVGTRFVMDKNSSQFPASIMAALRSRGSFSIVSRSDTFGGADPTNLDEARQQAIAGLKQRYRAITAEDFEQLVLGQTDFNIARARCVPERDLTASDPDTLRSGHVSVIIVPDVADERPTPTAEYINQMREFLNERRLITCRHHVLGPGYTEVRIQARVIRIPQAQGNVVSRRIQENLRMFFHPLKGGPEPNEIGWPFGRDIYISEVYQVIEETEDVDHVESLTLHTRAENGNWTEAGDRVTVAPRNLVHFDVGASEITVKPPI